MKHTPGPWNLDYDTIYFGDDVCENKIALASHRGYTPENQAEKLANAKLIAAAPELLAMLKKLVDDCSGENLGTVKTPSWTVVCEAAALIHKATRG